MVAGWLFKSVNFLHPCKDYPKKYASEHPISNGLLYCIIYTHCVCFIFDIHSYMAKLLKCITYCFKLCISQSLNVARIYFIQVGSVGIIQHKDYAECINGSLKFVVSGKMGTGKSALINGLSGKTVAKEGMSPLRVTNEITGYELTIKATDKSISKNVEVVIFDTPGLADPFHDEEANLIEISKHCKDADLLVYCLDMRMHMTSSDTKGMKEFTQRLGPDVWRNAVFVLTFANEAVPSKPRPAGWLEKFTFGHFRSSVDPERKENFRLLLTAKEEEIPNLFRNTLKLPEELSNSVSIVPAGYHKIPPPDRTDWLSEFWFTALRKIKQHRIPLLRFISSSSFQSHCKS